MTSSIESRRRAMPMPQTAACFTLLAIVVPTTLIAFATNAYGMRGEP